jgi:hypothetical protein
MKFSLATIIALAGLVSQANAIVLTMDWSYTWFNYAEPNKVGVPTLESPPTLEQLNAMLSASADYFKPLVEANLNNLDATIAPISSFALEGVIKENSPLIQLNDTRMKAFYDVKCTVEFDVGGGLTPASGPQTFSASFDKFDKNSGFGLDFNAYIYFLWTMAPESMFYEINEVTTNSNGAFRSANGESEGNSGYATRAEREQQESASGSSTVQTTFFAALSIGAALAYLL